MAKDYKRGADFLLYLNVSTWETPAWVMVGGVGDIDLQKNYEDIEIPMNDPETTPSFKGIRAVCRGTGHLKGEPDPSINFQLFDDAGSPQVEQMIVSMDQGVLLEIALCRGTMTTIG